MAIDKETKKCRTEGAPLSKRSMGWHTVSSPPLNVHTNVGIHGLQSSEQAAMHTQPLQDLPQ
jgi:hypothetical protein